MKKLLCTVLAVLLSVCLPVSVNAEDVATSAQAFALYCPDSGETLLSENAETELPMASTTKIMTTVLTLEEAARDNRVIEFTDEMTAEGSSMYLKRGEKVRLYDLAVGMMMQSGNDAANAAAISIAGSIEAFAQRMNEKAQEIGMTHTHFVTPSGLDDADHYSTACDMVLLTAYAMRNRDFAVITAQSEMTVHFVYPADKFVTYANHNKLLGMYDGCIGGKTGYTQTAGRCLVSVARRDGLTLIAVTLDDRDDWDDHIALYDYGFTHYRSVTLTAEEYTVDVVGGTEDSVKVKAEDVSLVVSADAQEPQVKITKPAFLYAPVNEGESVGKLEVRSSGDALIEVPLTAVGSVDYDQKRRSFITYIKDLLHWHS